jgi:hypothetical protein
MVGVEPNGHNYSRGSNTGNRKEEEDNNTDILESREERASIPCVQGFPRTSLEEVPLILEEVQLLLQLLDRDTDEDRDKVLVWP